MKVGDLVRYIFNEENPRGIGIVIRHSNDYHGNQSRDWFYIQWSSGLLTTNTKHHCEVLMEKLNESR